MHTDQALSILGLQRGATAEQIKAAYRAKSKEWHPDKAPADKREVHEGKMKDINAAYTFLEKHGAGSYGGGSRERGHAGFDYGFSGFDFNAAAWARAKEHMEEMMRRYSYQSQWETHEYYETVERPCEHCGGTGKVKRTVWKRKSGEPNF